MSLLDQVNQKKNVFTAEKAGGLAPEKAAMLNQTSDLLRIINPVLGHQMIPDKTMKKWADHRTRLCDARWTLTNIQGNVTEHIWANMIGKSLEGMLKKIKHSQPNGDWGVSKYEVDVKRNDDNIECIELAVLFVDGENQPDLSYRNGMPETMNIQVNNSGISEDLIKVIESKNSEDPELKVLLKGLIAAMSANSQAKAAPVEPAPVVEAKSPTKAKATKKPKAKEPFSAFDEEASFDDDGFDGAVPSPVSFE